MNRFYRDPLKLDASIPFVGALRGFMAKEISRDERIRRALSHLIAAEERHGLAILPCTAETPESLFLNEAEYDALISRHVFPFLLETSFMIAGLHYGQWLAFRFPNGKHCTWSSRGWGGMLSDFANLHQWKISEMRRAFQSGNFGGDYSKRIWSYADFADTLCILDDGEEWNQEVWDVLCAKWGFDPRDDA